MDREHLVNFPLTFASSLDFGLMTRALEAIGTASVRYRHFRAEQAVCLLFGMPGPRHRSSQAVYDHLHLVLPDVLGLPDTRSGGVEQPEPARKASKKRSPRGYGDRTAVGGQLEIVKLAIWPVLLSSVPSIVQKGPAERTIWIIRSPIIPLPWPERPFLSGVLVSTVPPSQPSRTFRSWLLASSTVQTDGPYAPAQHRTAPWWQVMCLTGVDYFSSLGYAPGIAVLAAGAVSPFATLVLVLLTVFGALPVYRRVAAASPHGEGSIAMLERLLPRWGGKLFVLALLGFAVTDFIITITLSAADAAAHLIENPSLHSVLAGGNIWVTLVLVLLLSAVFLKGFKEAIGIAVVLVTLFLGLNVVLMVTCVLQVLQQPEVWAQWHRALFTAHGSTWTIVGVSLLVFPKLALGMSGFETGVAVMPLVKGGTDDTEARPLGRIASTHKLLVTAALVMSAFLMVSSLICTLLIPAGAFQPGGEANGRALAYLAHRELGPVFGGLYDVSTIAILWFAGASAMAGLLNIVPRYLPRYGMAPDWTRANRPLVLVFSIIAVIVTLIFQANVDAQGGAYATGVLVLMTSAAVAVASALYRKRDRMLPLFAVIAAVFIYTTLLNMIERPEGLLISCIFITLIVLISVASRISRATELRIERVEPDATALQYLAEQAQGELRFITNHLEAGDLAEYRDKEQEVRAETHLPAGEPVLFLEVAVDDASEFSDVLEVRGVQVSDYRVLRIVGSSVPNAIAAFLLWSRDHTGKVPHVYFEWIEASPVLYAARFLLFGEGDIAPLTHEILRVAEPNRKRRPVVHVGG